MSKPALTIDTLRAALDALTAEGLAGDTTIYISCDELLYRAEEVKPGYVYTRHTYKIFFETPQTFADENMPPRAVLIS